LPVRQAGFGTIIDLKLKILKTGALSRKKKMDLVVHFYVAHSDRTVEPGSQVLSAIPVWA